MFHQQSSGFSLIELLLALMVSLVLATMMFQLFHQSERVLRDQMLIMEMQQTARIVTSQIADELSMAGQGLPLYASRLDSPPSEATAIFLKLLGIESSRFSSGSVGY
jgi:prepilin-type N-terminal cleavage/methylation domain-containing protein